MWWGWYFSKLWHAEIKVGVSALAESRSESVVSSLCVCLRVIHTRLSDSPRWGHTLLYPVTRTPPPPSSPPRRSHAMFWLPQPGHHGNLVYRCPSNSSNTALQNKKRKFSFLDKQAFSPWSQERKSTIVLHLEAKLMIFKVYCTCELWKIWFYKVKSYLRQL